MTQVSIQHAMHMALTHHDAGRLQQAESIYRQILQVDPRNADALHLLGVIAHQVNQQQTALGLIHQAIAINAGQPNYFSNLGEVYRVMRQSAQAVEAYRKALALQPDFAEAWSNLGNVLCELHRPDEALEACRRALAIKPSLAAAYNNLGNALEEKRDFAAAIEAYRRAIGLDPNFAMAWSNLGIALQQQGNKEQAAEAYRNALRADPHCADAHWNRALSLLLAGQFKEGWEEYEWRWQSKDFPSPIRHFPQPLFYQQDIDGKTILLHAEQGFGDAIQFARYVPLVAGKGAKVIVECQAELHRLFESLNGAAAVYDRGAPLPPFDLQAPFLSLPRAFATDISNIPQSKSYLKADATAVARWKSYLEKAGVSAADGGLTSGPLKVGLVWAGRPTHREDLNRSISLAAFGPLFQVPGVRFISLQMGPPAGQIAGSGLPIVDPSKEIKDFADTAALIANLDLVIAVDTAAVHLAGSLGIAVWTLLAWAPDWRWLENRSDTPWYPGMRLFRQPVAGDWGSVIKEVQGALSGMPRHEGGDGN